MTDETEIQRGWRRSASLMDAFCREVTRNVTGPIHAGIYDAAYRWHGDCIAYNSRRDWPGMKGE